jgi:Reverse transcriptase (RNA-dependent DNA polymerase)
MWAILNYIFRNKFSSQTDQIPDKLTCNSGQHISDPVRILDTLNEYFTTIAEKLKNDLLQQNGNRIPPETTISEADSSIRMVPTTRKEIKDIITNLKNDSATGLDKISTKILKDLSEDLNPHLVRTINKLMKQGEFLTTFKTARIVALHKDGAKDCPGNYRPIAIISNLSKIYEKILYNRIYNYLNDSNFFDEKQFGFLPHSNTTSAALSATSRIRTSMDKGCFTASIFIDVSKAFDCVDHAILQKKLLISGIRGNAYKIIQDYLFGRTQVVSTSTRKSPPRFMTHGIPQGSALSSLLFLIYINDILKLPLKGHLQLYADDAILTYSDHDFQRMQRNMREDLNLIYDWFYANLLSFNIRKTKYIIFYQKNKNIPNPDPLIVRNAEIERVTKTKYLGLILDEKLSWNEHIEYIKTKIRPFISMLRRTSYVLPSTTRLSVYHSYIHCHLSYLISVWGYTGTTRLEELTRFQNKAIRLIYWQEYRQGLSTDDLYKKYNILK